MKDARTLVDRYLQGWNETNPSRRRQLLEEVYVERPTYTDPMISAEGHGAIDATIVAMQEMFPGHVFSLAGEVDAHHDIARFQWQLTAPGADEPLVVGFDVAVLQDGRIRHVHGFLDKVPAAA